MFPEYHQHGSTHALTVCLSGINDDHVHHLRIRIKLYFSVKLKTIHEAIRLFILKYYQYIC